jgi:hypothetical protein
MAAQVVADWYCGFCEVQGRDRGAVPNCSNCGDAVTVTAWSLVPVDSPEPAVNIRQPGHGTPLPPAA